MIHGCQRWEGPRRQPTPPKDIGVELSYGIAQTTDGNLIYRLYKGASRPSPDHSGGRGHQRSGRGAPMGQQRLSKGRGEEIEREGKVVYEVVHSS
jgi:hypothetical protein